MPSRRLCLAILLFWTYTAAGLFHRDILPEMVVGPPPDLRDIARAGLTNQGVSKWALLVVDDRDSSGLGERAIGQVVTETVHQRDGGTVLESNAWFDANQLLPAGSGGRNLPLEAAGGDRIEVYGSCWIDSTGNLESFRVAIREDRPGSSDLLAIEGRLRNDRILITASGVLPYFGPSSLAYRPHGLVQSPLGPLEWMPNLHVGQRWESEVVSPLTGQVGTFLSEVQRTKILTWDNNPESTFEILTRSKGQGMSLSARTWVRRDGLVLRQEVPFPMVHLVLERLPEHRGGVRRP
jgi:hypothetical protein